MPNKETVVGVLTGALCKYIVSASRMADKWSESDEFVKQQLWKDLHSHETYARQLMEHLGIDVGKASTISNWEYIMSMFGINYARTPFPPPVPPAIAQPTKMDAPLWDRRGPKPDAIMGFELIDDREYTMHEIHLMMGDEVKGERMIVEGMPFYRTFHPRKALIRMVDTPNVVHISNAVKEVTDQIKNDEELYIGYQANIAMAMFDELERSGFGTPATRQELHKACNRGAIAFLNLWCDVSKTEADMQQTRDHIKDYLSSEADAAMNAKEAERAVDNLMKEINAPAPPDFELEETNQIDTGTPEGKYLHAAVEYITDLNPGWKTDDIMDLIKSKKIRMYGPARKD